MTGTEKKYGFIIRDNDILCAVKTDMKAGPIRFCSDVHGASVINAHHAKLSFAKKWQKIAELHGYNFGKVVKLNKYENIIVI